MSKTAFIFPGQGAQTAGMGKDFYENSRTAKDIFDMASELLSLDMRKLCFEKNDLLDKTEYTQAALVTVSMAAEHVLREWGMTADVTAGLSLGEYCAAASAGAFSTEDAVLMVRKRGIFMEEAVPANKGAMAAVIGLTGARTEEVLEKIPNVWIANYNCPGQLVITGEKSAVETAGSSLKEAGAKRVILLNVSGFILKRKMVCKNLLTSTDGICNQNQKTWNVISKVSWWNLRSRLYITLILLSPTSGEIT